MSTTRAHPGSQRRVWRTRDESGNSLAMIIVMMPLLLAAFGLGFDIAHNTYTRATLQGALDMAVAAGAATTTVEHNGDLSVDVAQAPAVVQQVYGDNRQKNVGLTCSGTGRCWTEPDGPPRIVTTVDPATGKRTSRIVYTVQEQTRNFFLQVVGLPSQTYRLTGTAEITARNT